MTAVDKGFICCHDRIIRLFVSFVFAVRKGSVLLKWR